MFVFYRTVRHLETVTDRDVASQVPIYACNGHVTPVLASACTSASPDSTYTLTIAQIRRIHRGLHPYDTPVRSAVVGLNERTVQEQQCASIRMAKYGLTLAMRPKSDASALGATTSVVTFRTGHTVQQPEIH